VEDNAMVQFITHHTDRYSYIDSATLALKGGCKWVQLRMKNADKELIYNTALQIKVLCREYNATFIIDDHVDIAKSIGADGVHLGKLDMPIAEARQLLGDKFLIGGTANTFQDVKNHYEAGADYIGCGPLRYTTTKSNLSPILGYDGYQKIIEQMRVAQINIPIVAIGGITEDDITHLMQIGLNGIALSGSILRAENPINEMNNIIKLTELWKN
jgi:thiamine-phosphate pyrophosphorylase